MGKHNSNIKHSDIVKYWENKFLTKNLEVIDHFEDDAIPIIDNIAEPKCWACGHSNHTICENPKYSSLLSLNKYEKIWDLEESRIALQKAHIIPRQFNNTDDVSNMFLLCKQCHAESPDYKDKKYFYAYILYVRNHRTEIYNRRGKELTRAIYELAIELHKNILTLNDTSIKSESINKAGIHGTNYALYTVAAMIVDSLDDLDISKLTEQDIQNIEKEYSKYDLKWKCY